MPTVRNGLPGAGQVVDLSLFEPLFRLCIPHLTIYDKLGEIRERVGNDFPDAAPRSLYRTEDEPLARPVGHLAEHLGGTGPGHGAWTPCWTTPVSVTTPPAWKTRMPSTKSCKPGWAAAATDGIMDELIPAGGVVGPVYNSAHIMADPHYHGTRRHR